MGRNDTRSHTAPTNKAFLEVKAHRRRSNWYTFNRVSVYCTELNNNFQSPHKTPSGGFPHCVPLTPGKKIHLNTFYPHLHNTDKSVVQTRDVLMHFRSSLELTGMNSSGPQERRTSHESHPRQPLSHPHHPDPETCGIASASFNRCTPEARAHLLIPDHFPALLLYLLAPRSSSSRSVIVPNSGAG